MTETPPHGYSSESKISNEYQHDVSDGFQTSLRPCALDFVFCLSIGRVKGVFTSQRSFCNNANETNGTGKLCLHLISVQISFRYMYFANSCFIHKLFSKVGQPR